MLARAVTWWLHPFVLITPVIDCVICQAVWAPKHDHSFTQLFKLSIGITTAALTSNVLLYRCYKSNSPLVSQTFWERGLNRFVFSAFIKLLCSAHSCCQTQEQQNNQKSCSKRWPPQAWYCCTVLRLLRSEYFFITWIIQMEQGHLNSHVLKKFEMQTWINAFTTCLCLCF